MTLMIMLPGLRKSHEKGFTVHDVIRAGFSLDPMVCLFCESNEVLYHDSVGDAYCGDCGKWQLETLELENEEVQK